MVTEGRSSLGQSASCHEKGGVALIQALKAFSPCLGWGRDGGTSMWGMENPKLTAPLPASH